MAAAGGAEGAGLQGLKGSRVKVASNRSSRVDEGISDRLSWGHNRRSGSAEKQALITQQLVSGVQ